MTQEGSLNYGWLQAGWYKGGWWVRLWRVGLRYHDHRLIEPLFSERMGLLKGARRCLTIGPHCFRLLTPHDAQAASTPRTVKYPVGNIPWVVPERKGVKPTCPYGKEEVTSEQQ